MNAAMYPLTLLITRKLKGDLFYLNVGLLVLTVVSFAHSVMLSFDAVQEKKACLAKKKRGETNDMKCEVICLSLT